MLFANNIQISYLLAMLASNAKPTASNDHKFPVRIPNSSLHALFSFRVLPSQYFIVRFGENIHQLFSMYQMVETSI